MTKAAENWQVHLDKAKRAVAKRATELELERQKASEEAAAKYSIAQLEGFEPEEALDFETIFVMPSEAKRTFQSRITKEEGATDPSAQLFQEQSVSDAS